MQALSSVPLSADLALAQAIHLATTVWRIRHTTRNFPNREGSKPGNGQMAAVALMDARSIAATAAIGGKLTSAWELDCWNDIPEYNFDDKSYKTVYIRALEKQKRRNPLVYGPNIKDWPEMSPRLTDNILLKVCAP